MKDHDEIEIRKLIKRAEQDWSEDLKLFRQDPNALTIDEPIREDYLAYEIYNYKYGKETRI